MEIEWEYNTLKISNVKKLEFKVTNFDEKDFFVYENKRYYQNDNLTLDFKEISKLVKIKFHCEKSKDVKILINGDEDSHYIYEHKTEIFI